MAQVQQLRLVTEPPPAHGTTQDPARQVFEHWVFMFGKKPARTKLDADRRKAIDTALALYDLPTVLQAVEGMAAAPMHGKPESLVSAITEIEWFLAKAARIERALEHADRLHAELIAQTTTSSTAAQPAEQLTNEQQAEQAARAIEARATLRALAKQLRSGVSK